MSRLPTLCAEATTNQPTCRVDLTHVVSESEFEPGTVVGGFLIEAFIAAGGGANVYRARDSRDGTVCALKVLHRAHALAPDMVLRFEREADIGTDLNHPNIVGVSRVGTLEDGRPFFAMEFLAGQTLSTVVKRTGPMAAEEAFGYLKPLADALTYAHAQGVVHRDLKGSNVAVLSEGPPPVVKLLDFGIAKLLRPDGGVLALTRHGDRLGTTSHMAPEQIRGDQVDHRVDIYSLGVMLFRMLTGHTPFEAPTSVEVERMHLEVPPPPLRRHLPSASAGLERVLARCLAKQPDERFSSVKDLCEAFEGELVPRPMLATSRPQPAFAIAVRTTAAGEQLEALADLLDECEAVLEGAGLLLVAPPPNGVLAVKLFNRDPTETELAPLRQLAKTLEAFLMARGSAHVVWKVGDALVRDATITAGSLAVPFW